MIPETGAEAEVLATALELVFIIVSCAQEELLVVAVFGTERHVYLAQLFLQTAGGIGERLEYA